MLVFLLTTTSQTEEFTMRDTDVQRHSKVVIVSYVNNKQTWTSHVEIKTLQAADYSNSNLTVTHIRNSSALVAFAESVIAVIATKVREEIFTANNNAMETHENIA